MFSLGIWYLIYIDVVSTDTTFVDISKIHAHNVFHEITMQSSYCFCNSKKYFRMNGWRYNESYSTHVSCYIISTEYLYTQYYYIRHNNINNLQLLKNTALEKVCYIIHIQCFHLGIIYHVTLFMLPNLNTSFIAHVT